MTGELWDRLECRTRALDATQRMRTFAMLQSIPWLVAASIPIAGATMSIAAICQPEVITIDVGASCLTARRACRSRSPRDEIRTAQGLAKVALVVSEYGRHFHHPGFKPIRNVQ